MKHPRLWEVLCEVVVLHITIRLKVLGNVCYSKKEEKLLQMNPGDFSPGCPKPGEKQERSNRGSWCQILVVFWGKSIPAWLSLQ